MIATCHLLLQHTPALPGRWLTSARAVLWKAPHPLGDGCRAAPCKVRHLPGRGSIRTRPGTGWLRRTGDKSSALLLVPGEAKWRSKVDNKQGEKQDKDQIVIRRELLEKYGPKLFPEVQAFAVVGISRPGGVANPGRERLVDGRDLVVGDLTWKKTCSLRIHLVQKELLQYLEWKNDHLKEVRLPALANAVRGGDPAVIE